MKLSKNKFKKNKNNKLLDKIIWMTLISITLINVYFSIRYPILKKSQELMTIVIIISLTIFVVLGKQTSQGRKAWDFILESRLEMNKVTWPGKQETIYSTIIVIAIVTITSLIIYLLGAIFMFIINIILS